ncbi:GGDEF domain-containing protein [Thalassotalea sp. 1_MG-2023]|uniref:GGDEF domain-containing protein n=1 Tax=Thalassotalea sp. 1_MG-2023 TaxID=3062680 RepID=UPI0026E4167F|nr:GGDEF domain-containing protein [Thalassotalea sp. 1_MG-2023]MDO6426321.1 GGDEF domain-containing protein [Thalassotalea sp. 1_MG-2023]
MMQTEKFDNIVILALISLTFVVIGLHSFSLNKTFTLDTKSPYRTFAISDTANGGKSKASLHTKGNKYLLDCHIIESDYAWPFCEITFSIGVDAHNMPSQPIDLSSYSTAHVYAKYIGENKASFRFQVRSYNQNYSLPNDDSTWKYNGIEYWPRKNQYPVDIPLNAMQVATWWLWEKEIPIEYAGPEFDQVLVVEVATGNSISPGHYQIEIDKVEFTGKVFTNKQVFTFIIAMWVFTAIIGLIMNLYRSKAKLKNAEQRAFELKQLNRLLNVESQELKDLAERDPLTGALNRKGIEHIFTNEIKVMSLMFIDIDHFKPLNDRYGHNIGDIILKDFVKLISENCRTSDFLARWGGEEFLLICPNTKVLEANELAEDLRQLIAEHNFVQNIKLTASFGLAQKENETIAELIERADVALYTAKAQGRNKVIVSNNVDLL